MILKKLRSINKNQIGFTLTELVIVLAISGVITSGVTAAVYQIISGNARSSNHMTAVRQVQDAGYWVSHDSQMAQSSSVNATATTGFPLTLTWTEWGNNNNCKVVYYLQNMAGSSLKRLQRSYSENGTTLDNSIVASYVDISGSPPKTSCNKTTEGVIIFTITVTVGTSPYEGNETRVYEIIPKPSL